MFLFLFSHASIGPGVPRGPHKNDKARDEKKASKKKRERKKKLRPKTFLGFNYSVLVSCKLGGVVYQHLLGQSFRRGSVKKIEFGARQLFLIYFFLIYFLILCCGCYGFFFLQSFTLPWSVKVIAVLFTRFIIFKEWCCCSVLLWAELPGAYICSEHRWNERNLIASEPWKR